MQQVLDGLYQDHRKELVNYRRHFILKKQKQGKKLKSDAKKKDLDYFPKNIVKSLDLVQKKKEIRSEGRNPLYKNYQLLSKNDGQVLKKYIQNYKQKETRLPKINYSYQIKTNSGNGTTQTSEVTVNSLKSTTKNFLTRKQRNIKTITQRSVNMKRFRKCVHAVMFLLRTKKKVKQKQIRFKRTLKLSHNLLRMIDKLVNKYYTNILKEPLLTYERILSYKIKHKNYNASQNIVLNIVQFSEKLKQSSIRKDILQFLILISTHNAYIPVDYFSQFQLLRLDFHSHSRKIARVSEQQLKMIIGVFIGIKVLCMYMFFEPWNIKLIDLDLKTNQKLLRPIIWAYGSFFYWSIIQIYGDLKAKNYKYLEKLVKRGWQPVFIHEETNQFFENVKKNYKKKYLIIINNIKQWIQRIFLAVLKNRQLYLE